MKTAWHLLLPAALCAIIGLAAPPSASAETPPAATADAQVAQPLSDKELEVLVARIALYPDELVALISAASLYPLQIIEADRFLTESKTRKDLKPKPDWDGSVVSLLNYPEIVHMMSDDLDWTKMMGEAIVSQQDGVLAAIQQLREKAVAENVIRSDDKVTVTQDDENIVIAPASKEVIYIPQYPPEMLYEDDYVYQPVTYDPEPYPYYYSPVAPFFAGAITGAFWGAIVDWDDGFWGGDWDWNDGWHGGDIDIDCNKCIIGGDFNGKLNIKDVDWSKVDRSKINFDRSQLDRIDRNGVKDRVKSNDRNRVRNKPGDLVGNRPSTRPATGSRPVKDVRASTLEGLKKQGGPKPTTLPGKAGDKMAKPGQGISGAKPGAGDRKPGNAQRPKPKNKAGAKVDKRPKNPSPLGDMSRGYDAKKQSTR
ncbi:DUF3300 domain-containing protein, partial [Aestuariivirga sp.]|uniref:DUF3300 domain-containing protein n=1 Tax=Aestuariivirga sp. TaxID=2650926 RepID=UPI0035B020B2